MQHWIAYDSAKPFAYLSTSYLEQGADPMQPTFCAEPTDAITLDLFICDIDYVGKGLSCTLIHEFLLKRFGHVRDVYIDPEMRNVRALRAYEKAGFQRIGEFVASWHPVPHCRMHLSMQNLAPPAP